MCEVVYVEFDHTRILVVPCKSLRRGGGERGREGKKNGETVGRRKKEERKGGRNEGKEEEREGEEIGRKEDEQGGGQDKQGDKGNYSLGMRMREEVSS